MLPSSQRGYRNQRRIIRPLMLSPGGGIVDTTNDNSSIRQAEETIQPTTTTNMMPSSSGSASNDDLRAPAPNSKKFKICSVDGGLDVTRFVSTTARAFFDSAIADVEFIREYISEAVGHHKGDFSSLEDLSKSLDWKIRELPLNTTTVEQGMGYVDDRPDRRIERYMSADDNNPEVGTKQNDYDLLDSVSNIFPWLVDRKAKESSWFLSHQAGRSQGPSKEPLLYDSLYTSAWAISMSGGVFYYPPLTIYGHPFNAGDNGGPSYDPQGEAFFHPSIPSVNPQRRAVFTSPYPDQAIPGLAMITAVAPIYYTGEFQGYTYNQTFIGATGVDIAIDSVSSYLDSLQDTLTSSSFGLLVTTNDLGPIVISQEVVHRVYPPLTGFEDNRISYDMKNTSHIVQDRRNQTYLPADTIAQPLIDLENAEWDKLQQEIERSGDTRGFTTLDLTLSGATEPVEYYVMYENWEHVADWTLLVFAPKTEVDGAVDIQVRTSGNQTVEEGSEVDQMDVLAGLQGETIQGSGFIHNNGTLDLVVAPKSLPSWVDMSDQGSIHNQTLLPAGQSLEIHFQVNTDNLRPGTLSSVLIFDVQDADYPDCFVRRSLSIPFSVVLSAESCPTSNQVHDINGNCVCNGSSVPVAGACIPAYALILAIVMPLLLAVLLLYLISTNQRRKQEDSQWQIPKKDLKFDVPAKVIGEGRFGYVWLGEYRGTNVAVKRMRPIAKPRFVWQDYSLRSTTSRSISASLFEDDLELAGFCEENLKLQETSETSSTSLRSMASGSIMGTSHDEFAREMKVLSSLRHPNLVAVMGAVLEKNRSSPFLVSEYMQKQSLHSLIHNPEIEFDGEMLLSILRDITQGMQFLHSMDPVMVHGNLKSRNILLDSRYRAKLCDIGPFLTKEGYSDSEFDGSQYFRAPEILQRESQPTVHSDSFSFGMILYELYSRKAPFEGEDPTTVLKQICDPLVQRRHAVPPCMKFGIRNLMISCVYSEPTERPSFNDIAADFRAFSPDQVESKRGDRHLDILLKKFPRHIAEAICDGQKVEAEKYPCITMVCCKIAAFERLSSEHAPEKVSDLLQRYFNRLDALSQDLGVHNVETAGDSWIGVTNCIQRQEKDHAKLVAEFSFGALHAATQTPIDLDNPALGSLQVKIGFHTGPVTTNLIGTTSPHLRFFGETPTIATLIAANCEPGHITCSLDAGSYLQVQAPHLERQRRGTQLIEGLGPKFTFYVYPPKGWAPGNRNTEGVNYET